MTEHVHDLLDRVHQAGARLSLNGDKLRVTATAELPDDLVEALRAAKPDLIDLLARSEPEVDARPGANVVLLAVPPGCPEAWVRGVANLLAALRPTAWPEERWTLLREDAFAFLRDRGAEAVRLGWHELDLFGINPRAPLARFDAMGLVVLLHGRRVAELHDDRAVIENRGSKATTFTRRPAPTTGRATAICFQPT